MCPAIELLGKTIPTYWLCSLAGISVCCIVAYIRHHRFQELQQVDITNSAALIFIGVIIGSRILYLISISPILIRNYQQLIHDRSLAYEVLSNGMVFYGGLFGAILVLFSYTCRYHLDRKAYFDYYAPLFPLFHAFGRIGCFLNGCCHGNVSEKYGIAFHESESALNDIPYFPIQLVCSFCNVILFLILVEYEKRHHRGGKTIYAYLFLYAIGRFFIEFWRGDTIRGIILGLSTSQWISIMILIGLGLCAATEKTHKKNVA